jgi:copper oxidase (laccase) domain-containing protein
VAGRFEPACVRPSGAAGRYLLDLPGANRRQLEAAGVRPDRVHRLPACTRERADLPSHRRAPDGARFACLAAIR